MFGMGHWELLIIFVIVLLVFGAKRIPEMAQGMGRGIREFRKAVHDVQDEIDLNKPAGGSSTQHISAPQESVAQNPAEAPQAEAGEKPRAETSSSNTA